MAQAVKVKNGETPSGSGMSPSGAIQGVVERFKSIKQFLHEVRLELRQVTWPSKDDVRSTTAVVIVTVFFFGLYLFLVDRLAQQGVDYLFTRFNR